MYVLSKIIIIILLWAGVTCGQDLFDGNGKPFEKVLQNTKQPKIIIDTVDITNGFGNLVLNNRFQRKNHDVSSTDSTTIWAVITPILSDTTGTVYYYGYAVSKGGDTIKVISNGGGSDDGKVCIVAFIK